MTWDGAREQFMNIVNIQSTCSPHKHEPCCLILISRKQVILLWSWMFIPLQKCKSPCIGSPGDDNLYILKIEQTRTGVLTYVVSMCSYLVADVFSRMFFIMFDWSFLWFFRFLCFLKGNKGPKCLNIFRNTQIKISYYMYGRCSR